MTDEQTEEAKIQDLLHIPTVLGAVVPAYNIPGSAAKSSSRRMCWRESFWARSPTGMIRPSPKSNPGVKLPDQAIIVVHRSDGSGTTYIWTDYLSKVSNDWKSTRRQGNFGELAGRAWAARAMKASPGRSASCTGSIGYVELIYAVQNKIPYGSVQNAAGNFVKASLEGVTEAAAAAQEHAGRFSCLHHQCAGQDGVPDLQFHLAADSGQSKDASKGKILAIS